MTEQTVEEFITDLINTIPRLARPAQASSLDASPGAAFESPQKDPRSSEPLPPN